MPNEKSKKSPAEKPTNSKSAKSGNSATAGQKVSIATNTEFNSITEGFFHNFKTKKF